MEPLDEDLKLWRADMERAYREQEAKRAEFYKNARALTAARKLAEARRVLAAMAPSPSFRERNWVSIYVASEAELVVSSMIAEGVVFDIYGVMCGHMDGRDDFDAFDIITAEEEISSWRLTYPQIARGSKVRIKYIEKGNSNLDGDHIDDVVLEVWIEQ